MTYSASVQWICPHAGLIRLHEGPGGRYGDPYVWWTAFAREGDTAEIMGADRPLPLGGPRAVVAALRAEGLTGRKYDRPGRLVVKANRAG